VDKQSHGKLLAENGCETAAAMKNFLGGKRGGAGFGVQLDCMVLTRSAVSNPEG
jgi:hypothetical protein